MTEGSRQRNLARLQVLAAAALFSTGGAAIKAVELDGWQVAGLRAGIAVLFLLLAAPSARRGWTLGTIPVALTFGATLLLFVLANKQTTAANTIFLQSTAPLYLLLLSPWLLKERLKRRDLVTLALIAVGMALFFLGIEASQITAPEPASGNALAAAAGFFWALTVIGLRWLSRAHSTRAADSMPSVVLGNVVVFAACAPALSTLARVSTGDLLVVGFLGVVQIGVAYMFLTKALRRVPAIEASLLLMAEPVLSPLWAWWLHGESASRWALAGGALILSATALPSIYALLRRSSLEVP